MAGISMNVVPVILSGGVGSRLWPVSREAHPKQLHALTSDRTMIQETALRARGTTATGSVSFQDPVIVCNRRHADAIIEQLEAIGAAPSAVIAEPVGRNTAPAAALAALAVLETDPNGILLLLPADHHITDPAKFTEATVRAGQLAQDGYVVTYGIVPNRPETGYGYIGRGEGLASVEGSFTVAEFVEKPNRPRAEEFVASGTHYWNGGIFAVRADILVQEMERHCPDILASCRASIAQASRSNRVLAPDPDLFAASPSDSIDYAVMERTARAAVVPVDMGWNDVGSWAAIYDVSHKDADGNAVSGDVVLHEAKNVLVRASSRLVTVAGIDDVVVIETPDAVLVTSREKAQAVKGIVTQLKDSGRSEL